MAETAPPAFDAPDTTLEEDAGLQRKNLVAVWASAGSAVAVVVALLWQAAIAGGGRPPGGDMVPYAATAEWLRTLPWWHWRGWSDWFFGGQPVGVNYPPLGHLLLRFTHPVYGQTAAVTVGLLVLLPWGALRLARAVGYPPRGQRAAVAAALVVAAAATEVYWLLPGFQLERLYASWPAMLATVVGLFAAAWAARCERPAAAGVTAGLAVLLNPSVVPGVALVCAVLLATSGATARQALRWAATAAAAAVAVSAWWLVPFVAELERLLRWEVTLPEALSRLRPGSQMMVAALFAVAAAAARRSRPARRLAAAAAAGLLAAVAAESFGYLRPERLLPAAVLAAAVAAAGLAAGGGVVARCRAASATHAKATGGVRAAGGGRDHREAGVGAAGSVADGSAAGARPSLGRCAGLDRGAVVRSCVGLGH